MEHKIQAMEALTSVHGQGYASKDRRKNYPPLATDVLQHSLAPHSADTAGKSHRYALSPASSVAYSKCVSACWSPHSAVLRDVTFFKTCDTPVTPIDQTKAEELQYEKEARVIETQPAQAHPKKPSLALATDVHIVDDSSTSPGQHSSLLELPKDSARADSPLFPLGSPFQTGSVYGSPISLSSISSGPISMESTPIDDCYGRFEDLCSGPNSPSYRKIRGIIPILPPPISAQTSNVSSPVDLRLPITLQIDIAALGISAPNSPEEVRPPVDARPLLPLKTKALPRIEESDAPLPSPRILEIKEEACFPPLEIDPRVVFDRPRAPPPIPVNPSSRRNPVIFTPTPTQSTFKQADVEPPSSITRNVVIAPTRETTLTLSPTPTQATFSRKQTERPNNSVRGRKPQKLGPATKRRSRSVSPLRSPRLVDPSTTSTLAPAPQSAVEHPQRKHTRLRSSTIETFSATSDRRSILESYFGRTPALPALMMSRDNLWAVAR